VTKTDVEIKIKHAGQPHEVGLGNYYYSQAGTKKIKHTVVLIGQAEDGPIPKKVEEEKHHSKRIIDAAAIVAFRFHFFSAYLAFIFQSKTFAQRENAFIYKYGALSATRAFHGK